MIRIPTAPPLEALMPVLNAYHAHEHTLFRGFAKIARGADDTLKGRHGFGEGQAFGPEGGGDGDTIDVMVFVTVEVGVSPGEDGATGTEIRIRTTHLPEPWVVAGDGVVGGKGREPGVEAVGGGEAAGVPCIVLQNCTIARQRWREARRRPRWHMVSRRRRS